MISPKNSRPKARSVTTGYFGDLAKNSYKPQFGREGGHIGIGPIPGAGTLGAAAIYVPINPSIRTSILTARFMGFLLACG